MGQGKELNSNVGPAGVWPQPNLIEVWIVKKKTKTKTKSELRQRCWPFVHPYQLVIGHSLRHFQESRPKFGEGDSHEFLAANPGSSWDMRALAGEGHPTAASTPG